MYSFAQLKKPVFFTASKIFDYLTSPTVWIVFCFLIGWFKRNGKIGRRFQIVGLSLLLFLSNPFIISQLLQVWEVPSRNAKSITNPYDVGIVLGGSMRYYNNETQRVVYGSSVDRVLQAIQLYHDKKIKKILFSGGSGYVMMPDWKEAAWLAEMTVKCGVPKEDIIIENESRNTFENAVMTTTILKTNLYGNRFLLITSALHMRRSLLCFEKAGLKTEPFSVDERSGKGIYTPDKIFIPDVENINNWDSLIHEWLGIFAYKLAGYI